jgi:hypothetical protein
LYYTVYRTIVAITFLKAEIKSFSGKNLQYSWISRAIHWLKGGGGKREFPTPDEIGVVGRFKVPNGCARVFA